MQMKYLAELHFAVLLPVHGSLNVVLDHIAGQRCNNIKHNSY